MLFLPALEHLRTLYPGAYAWGATPTTPSGLEREELELGAHAHTVSARFELFLGGGDPSLIRQSLLVGVHSNL